MRHVPCIGNVQGGGMRPCLLLCMGNLLVMYNYNHTCLVSSYFSAGLRFPFPRNSRAMAKKFTSRGISAGFPRVFRAVVIKVLLNSRRGNHV